MELLTTQPANYNRLMAMQVMENLLQRFPKVDVVLAPTMNRPSDASRPLMLPERLKEIKVTGVDSNYDAANSIMSGRQFASADYSGHDQGYLATKAAINF